MVCPSGTWFENRPHLKPSIHLEWNPKHIIVQWVGIGTHTFSHTYQLLLYIVDAPNVDIFVVWYQLSNSLVIEASLCFQPILYAGLQLIVPKCCPMTVSYEERDENHREPSLGWWWWVIKHFPLKMLQEPLHYCCSMLPSIVMKKDNTWAQHSYSLVLNKGNKLQHTFHIWQETLLF